MFLKLSTCKNHLHAQTHTHTHAHPYEHLNPNQDVVLILWITTCQGLLYTEPHHDGILTRLVPIDTLGVDRCSSVFYSLLKCMTHFPSCTVESKYSGLSYWRGGFPRGQQSIPFRSQVVQTMNQPAKNLQRHIKQPSTITDSSSWFIQSN